MDEPRMRYDAFLSYSHASDLRIAPVLHQLARRWNKVWALRVFRDKESLAANPDLWGTIDEALRASRFFILLASPEAAVSPWVRREVEYWRSERERLSHRRDRWVDRVGRRRGGLRLGADHGVARAVVG